VRWFEAELMDEALAKRLHDFEVERERTSASRQPLLVIALLGALSVVVGLGTLVAYNWAGLADELKLGGGFVLLAAAVGWAAFEWQKRGPGPRLDVPLALVSGVTLADLALVSQIYRQDGELWQLLTLWCSLVGPALWASRTRFVSHLWYLSIFVTLVSGLDAFEHWLRPMLPTSRYGDAWPETLLLASALSVGLASAFARSSVPRRRDAGVTYLGAHLLALGAAAPWAWIHDGAAHPLSFGPALVTWTAAAPGLLSAGPRLGLGTGGRALGLAAAGLSILVVPLFVPDLHNGFLAFVTFCGLWGAVWWCAEQARSARVARIAVGLLAGRILLASFELFDSLLVSGLVLLAMGVALVLVSGARLRGDGS
jgi:uncharacterized membrane protein